MRKYHRLTDYLRAKNEDIVDLTYDEMESILGFRLPGSARRYKSWWGNYPQGHRFAWLSAGYRYVCTVYGEKVRFAQTDMESETVMNPESLCCYNGKRCWFFFWARTPEERRLAVVQFLEGEMTVMGIPEDDFRLLAVPIPS